MTVAQIRVYIYVFAFILVSNIFWDDAPRCFVFISFSCADHISHQNQIPEDTRLIYTA